MTPRESATSRDGSIDVYRWICILAVVVHHSVSTTRESGETVRVLLALKEPLGWCVAGFIFVSGWLARPEVFGWMAVWKRGVRLMLPFLCVNAVVGLVMFPLVRAGIVHGLGSDAWTPAAIGRRMLYLQGLGPQYYFLPALFLSGTFALGVARLFGRAWGALILVAFELLTCIQFGVPSTPYGSQIDRLPFYAALFGLGMLLRDKARTRWGFGIVAVPAAVGVGALVEGSGTALLHVFVAIALFFLVRVLVAGRPCAFATRWSSGSLYLWHAPIVLPLWVSIFQPFNSAGWIQVPLAIGCTVLTTQAIDLAARKAGLGAYFSL